jgi:hypothetical protein
MMGFEEAAEHSIEDICLVCADIHLNVQRASAVLSAYVDVS